MPLKSPKYKVVSQRNARARQSAAPPHQPAQPPQQVPLQGDLPPHLAAELTALCQRFDYIDRKCDLVTQEIRWLAEQVGYEMDTFPVCPPFRVASSSLGNQVAVPLRGDLPQPLAAQFTALYQRLDFMDQKFNVVTQQTRWLAEKRGGPSSSSGHQVAAEARDTDEDESDADDAIYAEKSDTEGSSDNMDED